MLKQQRNPYSLNIANETPIIHNREIVNQETY